MHKVRRPDAPAYGLSKFVPRILRDRKGTGAIEFAMIVPIMLALYMGSFELSLGFSMARKVSRASSTIADLVAQRNTISASDLDKMKTVIERTLEPLGGKSYTMKITGISVASNGDATVAWSRNENGARAYTTGSAVTLPNGLAASTTFLVRAEVTAPYTLWLYKASADQTPATINLAKTYYFRQRVGDSITCSDC
ncbi:Flp pilus assembly protein TadG [Rhizobium sp. RU20A]|uniref:TadE/TadG family type IV pilus assembly protein n=1 Tax=Rhizobium sp. RU20A TaxID=1907412 RepID=UPI0009575164|nr:TadE/TadG family type IV pilus assembly protein [Rhizobium sp. RU20A]SIQ77724.1 Flp pilus assembly protein TadG [Rhizobium sp. RU20A]